jgi:hypothetical protein
MELRQVLATRHPCQKCDVLAEIVVVLSRKISNRGLKLISPYSRAVVTGGIHEFIVTDESRALPLSSVDRAAYVGFAEIKKGGVIMVGEQVSIVDHVIGQVVGFDETHMPNHLNIVVYSTEWKSGFDHAVSVGQQMRITGAYL